MKAMQSLSISSGRDVRPWLPPSSRLAPLIYQIATFIATCRDYYVAAISYEQLSRRPEMRRCRADLARSLCEAHDRARNFRSSARQHRTHGPIE